MGKQPREENMIVSKMTIGLDARTDERLIELARRLRRKKADAIRYIINIYYDRLPKENEELVIDDLLLER